MSRESRIEAVIKELSKHLRLKIIPKVRVKAQDSRKGKKSGKQTKTNDRKINPRMLRTTHLIKN